MKTSTKIADALRKLAPEGKLKAPEIPLIDEIAAMWDARANVTREPGWINAARSKLGQGEIVGSKHNPWIVGFWQRLGAKWFNDDETPWCGGFVAWCLDDAGLTYPKEFPRAASFRTYGDPCTPQLGAIGVKARKGGNHVFFIVGETPDKRYYKALGGNQGNAVTIMDILKSDTTDVRWPAGSPQLHISLPVLPKGTVSRNEG